MNLGIIIGIKVEVSLGKAIKKKRTVSLNDYTM